MEPCAIVPLAHAGDFEAAATRVAGEAPLVRVVRSVLEAVADERVTVATVPALAAATVECLRAAGLATAVAVAPAPGSRHQVIRAGLEHLGAEAHTAVSVLICDHRYPLAPGQLADRVLAVLPDGHDVVVPILPVTDTVKAVDELGSVLGTVDRSALRTVQYPRGFTASALWQLISVSPAAASDDLDEFDAALWASLDIGTVDGDANAIQFELPRDAHLLDAVMACRPG
jgi:2-C-methyl-D-erythritol 4-phosphate cytidylyltransferase